MKKSKLLLSSLSAAALAFSLTACSGTVNVNTPTGNPNQSNTIIVNNSNKSSGAASTPAKTATPAADKANSGTPASKPDAASDAAPITGELQKGESESLILYVGTESGDYAAYCFSNNSEDGRKILNACADGGQCEVMGETESGSCKVPDLEADLSDSGRIVRVVSAKPLGRRK